MGEYVSLEAVVGEFEKICAKCYRTPQPAICKSCWVDDGIGVVELVEPEEEVAPVIHAHWIKGGDGMWDDGRLHIVTCSNCKALFRYHGKKSNVNYCYKCGARMDEEVSE